MPKEYYRLLGVSEDASQEDIKKAYRKKAKKYHPDSNADTADEEKFKKINKAYQVLGDEEKRKKYDRFGKQAVDSSAASGRQRGGFSGFQDLFNTIFGGGGQRRQRSRGQHLKVTTSVTLEEAYTGTEKTFEVTRKSHCDACDGTGAEDGHMNLCDRCGGQGRIDEVRQTPLGSTRVHRRCPKCSGNGRVPETACSSCDGSGVAETSETITVNVPAGIRNGQKLRIDNKGHVSANGEPGNLYVFVSVEDHDLLERKGDDLFTTLKIGIGDAVLGTTARVPVPGSEIEVDVPAGVQPGQVLRVQGQGMPSEQGEGDLYVKIDVAVPEDIDDEQRAVFEELREDSESRKSFFETVKDLV